MTTPTKVIVTETRSSYISGLNRGPITSVFAPAPSCSQTLRLTADGTNSWLYSGHAYQEYYQSGCMPTGTKVEAAFSDREEWDSYYCKDSRVMALNPPIAKIVRR